ncbi:Isoleucine--tRNA ligase [bioreactor metagenome]|uniref:Isoleucine--tRNA ligase n=1 Tax=bioreactor metagenome TaxID=1076179 RepID=A0A644Y9S2_9ZZZZ
MYRILDGMTRMLAPILAFTGEEIWEAMPHDSGADTGNVLYNDMPAYDEAAALSPGQAAKWDKLIALRADVNRALEQARNEKLIGKSLEANVTLYITDPSLLEASRGVNLAELCIVSSADVVNGEGKGFAGAAEGLTVSVSPAGAPKCVRCWMHSNHVGESENHPELCPRCAAVVGEQG